MSVKYSYLKKKKKKQQGTHLVHNKHSQHAVVAQCVERVEEARSVDQLWCHVEEFPARRKEHKRELNSLAQMQVREVEYLRPGTRRGDVSLDTVPFVLLLRRAKQRGGNVWWGWHQREPLRRAYETRGLQGYAGAN
jgi:hypothetical protein